MTDPPALRQANEVRALQRLLTVEVMSRADLARDLRVTRSTASSIVASLIGNGQVLEQDSSANPDIGASDHRGQRTGRPAIQLRLNPDHALYLGADIGARSVRLCAVDFAGRQRHMIRRTITDAPPTPEQAAKQLAEMVSQHAATLPRPQIIAGLNVAIPGIVDLAGDVLRAPPLGWKRVAFRTLLQAQMDAAALSVPVGRLVNDANAFAVAVRCQTGAVALRDAVFLLLEDGVGGSIFSNDRMLEGASGLAGEIGHMPVGGVEPGRDPGGQTPEPAAFETLVARGPILKHYAALNGRATGVADVLRALDARQPAAQTVLAHWAANMGRGLAVLTTLLNPSVIVIGGRVSAMFERSSEQVAAALARNLLFDTPPPQLHLADVGPEGPAIGAAMMLHRAAFASTA